MHTDQTVIIINTLVETIWLTSCFCKFYVSFGQRNIPTVKELL